MKKIRWKIDEEGAPPTLEELKSQRADLDIQISRLSSEKHEKDIARWEDFLKNKVAADFISKFDKLKNEYNKTTISLSLFQLMMGMDYVVDECYYAGDHLNDSYLIKQIESAPIFKEFQKIMKTLNSAIKKSNFDYGVQDVIEHFANLKKKKKKK